VQSLGGKGARVNGGGQKTRALRQESAAATTLTGGGQFSEVDRGVVGKGKALENNTENLVWGGENIAHRGEDGVTLVHRGSG